jgi:hypothetical protein
VWSRKAKGGTLRFHLAGINNQNFIMRDEETDSWWQQVSGEAIEGPLSGEALEEIPHDELTFATWKREHPNGRVLRPEPVARAEKRYARPDWEDRIGRLPVVTELDPKDPVNPRAIVVGVVQGSTAKAFDLSLLGRNGFLRDDVGGVPILLLVDDDGRSVRAFEASIAGRSAKFAPKVNACPTRWLDDVTGSEWDFEGRALDGLMAGASLRRVDVLLDYWFDWKAYHPTTSVLVAPRVVPKGVDARRAPPG